MDQYTEAPRSVLHCFGTDEKEHSETVEGVMSNLILGAIVSTRQALEGKIDSFSIELNFVRVDVCKVINKTREIEAKVVIQSPDTKELQATVRALIDKTKQLDDHLEDSEDGAGGCNLCFIIFSKGQEGSSLEAFLESWLQSIVDSSNLSAS
ncbi:hypothetical protein NDU88_002933 [Pleurodeles waltl]|uniref:Uncharacterized protein n=1 Tax=Pleurodeles waltl TaxID=8319 RepID=A0AAV7NF57_PLEWA|nr:hypothetical protein NDU88_002933 [Pleurodeles waltl]